MQVLIIIPNYGYWDYDLLKTLELFTIEDKIFIASLNGEVAYGKLGGKVLPDLSLTDIIKMPYRPFDVLILIADEGWEEYMEYRELKGLIANFLSHPKKLVIAISLAPLYLAKTGIIIDKIVTGNYELLPNLYEEFLKCNTKPITHYVFKDGNLITCFGRQAIYKIKDYLIEFLNDKNKII